MAAEFFSGDRLNPVFVKEMRQYFHNRILLSLMGLFLVGELMLLVFMRFLQEQGEKALGSTMFWILTAGMTGCTLLVTAWGGYERFSAERRLAELDYSKIADLTPFRIISGKLLGALVMTAFLLSLTVPFMLIAYFLRGISIPMMGSVLLMLIPPVLMTVQLGLLAASTGLRWSGAPAFGAALIGWLILAGVTGGIASSRYSSLTWTALFFFLLFAALFLILFSWTAAVMSSPLSNRSMPVRICHLAIFVLSPLLGITAANIDLMGPRGWNETCAVLLTGLAAAGSIIAALTCSTAVWERESPGERVLRSAPKNVFGRFAYFLISSGPGGGIMLAWIFQLILFGNVLVLMPCCGASVGMLQAARFFLNLGFYALAYSQIALLLRWKFPKFPGWTAWIVSCAVFAALPLIPFFLFVFSQQFRGTEDVVFLLVTTPFAILKDLKDPALLVWGAGFAALTFAASSGIIFRMCGVYLRGKETPPDHV